jgi:UDP-N-acetylmuramate--alanine ligase
MEKRPEKLNSHFHLIGIGGIGMSGIAQLLLRKGCRVSGSDIKENKSIENLKKIGAQVFVGHCAQNIRGADFAIYSSAIKEDNPEIKEARKNGIALLKRAQALAELMREKTVITVTGSHGKTTTSSLVAHLLLEAGLFPTIAVGGIFKNIDANAYFGDGKFFVAEADESDGSFLYYSPRYSLITNIDHEHLDYYRDFANELRIFKEFIGRTEKGGCVIACNDDLNLKNLFDDYKERFILFGLNEGSNVYANNINLKGLSSEFDCFIQDKLVGRFFLNLGGKHNISNSLAVIALGLELGISTEVIKKALANYKGSARRLDVKYNDGSNIIIDDYAHHPTEIKATLSAAKNLVAKRLIAVFQPHRYSRAKLLAADFALSFSDADCVIVTDIYSASEDPIEGVTGESLYQAIKEKNPGKSVKFMSKEKASDYLKNTMRKGDLVITLGAGDINKVCDELAKGLQRKN